MISIETRGRIYLSAFTATLIVGDLALKALFVIAGSLRWSQAAGTAVTLLALWFLWRGSRAAYWYLVACMVAALIYVIWVAVTTQIIALAWIAVPISFLLLTALAPATRKFLAVQRATGA
ncbi:hypothetical protein [Xanthomonas sp. 1678]|uniref:hypothetical protein n=1 Tax=Xanthomonas sp. 1678 TaxID=3158788 RepID=UPI002862DCAE|nr:glucose dehydrogenase [Xanthomonas translucens]